MCWVGDSGLSLRAAVTGPGPGLSPSRRGPPSLRGPGRLHYLAFFPRSVKRGASAQVSLSDSLAAQNPARPGTLARPLPGPSPLAHFLTCPAWGPHGGHGAEERPRVDQALGSAWLCASPVALPPCRRACCSRRRREMSPPCPVGPGLLSRPRVCVCVPRVHTPYVRTNKPVCVCSWNAHAGRLGVPPCPFC